MMENGMGSMMDGGVKPAVAKSLGADLQGRAQGSTGLANLIVAGSIRPDVFIAITPGPMRTVLKAGKATKPVKSKPSRACASAIFFMRTTCDRSTGGPATTS